MNDLSQSKTTGTNKDVLHVQNGPRLFAMLQRKMTAGRPESSIWLLFIAGVCAHLGSRPLS